MLAWTHLVNCKKLIPFLPVLLLGLAACSPIISEAGPVSTELSSEQADEGPNRATQFALEADEIAAAAAVANLKATEDWNTLIAQQTSTPEPISPEKQAQATQQASSLATQVESLVQAGDLSAPAGRYYALPDFEASWAQINFYDFLLSEYMPANFVVRAKAEWDTAKETANLENAGCGFVFRMNARGDHYLAFLGMDGWGYLYQNLAHNVTRLAKSRYNPKNLLKGSADLMVVAEGESIALYANGTQIFRHQDPTFSTGLLGYAIISGTNESYGTRCKMTGVELWQLDSK